MILVIDNYDSFVETLARYVREAGEETLVVKNDALTPAEALTLRPTGILLSPGPAAPTEAGICLDLIAAAPSVPILGVCLGHQALCDAYGGRTVRSPDPVHGRASAIRHDGHALFAGVPSPFAAGRYHSLLGEVAPHGPLRPIAWTEADGLLMGVAHETHPHWGVQFHPESLLTPEGHRIVENFVHDALEHRP